MASITDKFSDTYNAANPNVARVTGIRAAAGASLSCDNLAGWPTNTKVHFSTYKINTSNAVIAGSQIDWEGIVTGNTIGTMTRITGATDNGNAVNDVVMMNPTGKWASELVNGILIHSDQDGTLKAGAVDNAAVLASDVVTTAKILDSAVTSAKVATGVSVQTVSTNFSAVSTGTTLIPYDDTIPQITEGFEVMTQAITPKSTTNRLKIEVTLMGASNAVGDLTIALFQDATANALAADSFYSATTNGQQTLKLAHDMVAGTTSSTTFRVRFGSSVAGTFTFNGSQGLRRFGGITVSNMTITEYKA